MQKRHHVFPRDIHIHSQNFGMYHIRSMTWKFIPGCSLPRQESSWSHWSHFSVRKDHKEWQPADVDVQVTTRCLEECHLEVNMIHMGIRKCRWTYWIVGAQDANWCSWLRTEIIIQFSNQLRAILRLSDSFSTVQDGWVMKWFQESKRSMSWQMYVCSCMWQGLSGWDRVSRRIHGLLLAETVSQSND